jgi:hypothetical protein
MAPLRVAALAAIALAAIALAALPLARAAHPGEEPPAPLSVGDRLPAFQLDDQHGRPGQVDASVRLLLFAADMDAGGLVDDALEGDASLRDLAARGAVFVSDIHRMPALVTRLFALPSMRRRPYRMLLDREPGPTLRIPRREGQVTLLALESLTIRRVDYADTPKAVAEALRQVSRPAAKLDLRLLGGAQGTARQPVRHCRAQLLKKP